jgi:hypothetical protein
MIQTMFSIVCVMSVKKKQCKDQEMSRVAIVSHYAENYRELSQMTWNQNKALYCARYGYTGYNFLTPWHPKIGFDKFKAALTIIDHHDWVWITGCDSLITNFQIDVYDHLDLGNGAYSFVGAFDCNGLNGDSCCFKNDICGKTLLMAACGLEPIADNEQWSTIFLIEHNQYWEQRTKFAKQWEMNSYLYGLYPGAPTVDAKHHDRGEWNDGDLFIHWPGVSLQRRLDLAREYLPRVRH